jgi:hypothetical protein
MGNLGSLIVFARQRQLLIQVGRGPGCLAFDPLEIIGANSVADECDRVVVEWGDVIIQTIRSGLSRLMRMIGRTKSGNCWRTLCSACFSRCVQASASSVGSSLKGCGRPSLTTISGSKKLNEDPCQPVPHRRTSVGTSSPPFKRTSCLSSLRMSS